MITYPPSNFVGGGNYVNTNNGLAIKGTATRTEIKLSDNCYKGHLSVYIITELLCILFNCNNDIYNCWPFKMPSLLHWTTQIWFFFFFLLKILGKMFAFNTPTTVENWITRLHNYKFVCSYLRQRSWKEEVMWSLSFVCLCVCIQNNSENFQRRVWWNFQEISEMVPGTID